MEPQKWLAEVKATIGKWFLEREGKEPLHGFMRVDHGMLIVSGYGRYKERRIGSSPPELIVRLRSWRTPRAGEADQKRNDRGSLAAPPE